MSRKSQDFKATISRPLKIYYENSATLAFSNNKLSSRLLAIKHDVKYYVLKDILEGPLVLIYHISTSMMIVDPLTDLAIPTAI